MVRLLLVCLMAAAWFASSTSSHERVRLLLPGFLAAYALLQICIVGFLVFNHAPYPMNLEAMELTVLATVRRVVEGLPIYVAPSSAFIPLAYNPFFYYLALPFVSLFGDSLLALRIEAITGLLGCGAVVFLAVRRETSSSWWATIAVGLFAASYQAMDSYLDNAHADSWMLFCALLGVYLVSLHRSLRWDLVGVGLGVISFWFKQPGAVLCGGLVVFLTLRRSRRDILAIWTAALLFGPVLYALAPGGWFGPLFHRYTWDIPRGWMSINVATFRRLGAYLLRNYGLLALLGMVAWLFRIKRLRQENAWLFTLPFAALTALTGAMDAESNNNVFIPLSTWLIVAGVIVLARTTKSKPRLISWRVPQLVAGASFVLLVFNPVGLLVSSDSGRAYRDLQGYLTTLGGAVYAPWIGPLQDGYEFYPAVHWVPMTDVVRRPGLDLNQSPFVHDILDPVSNPSGQAYLLMNYPLENDSALKYLGQDYVLDKDLGARFQPLSTLPHRYDLLWPRFLYVHRPSPPS